MTRCLIYLRVSSKEQAEEGYSIAAQREACLRLIQERGWVLVDEYVDADESARTADRPAFQAMLNRIADERSIRALVVHKLDRLARNLEDHVAVRARMRKLDVDLVSVTEGLEESASGKLVEGILASIAEFYSANLSLEIRKGQLQKAREGGWLTTAPIGYRNVRVPRGGRRGEAIIVPDEEQAPLVREAFELYATGDWPLTRLHEAMVERGLRTGKGKPPARSYVASMLKNKIYTGKIIWHEVEYEGIHEPLISRELFDRVQEVFRLHDRAGERQRRHNHYLKGTLFCGTCGSRLSITLAKGRFPYFFCLGRHQRRTDCQEPYLPVEVAEQQVEECYGRMSPDEERVRPLVEVLDREIERREGDNGRAAGRWRRRLTDLEAEREKLLRAYYEDAVPLHLFKREQHRIDAEAAEAETHVAADTDQLAKAREVVDVALKPAVRCERAYANAAPQRRRLYNHAFFDTVYFQGRQATEVAHRAPFDALLGGSIKEGQVRPAGFEPATRGLEVRRSVHQISYPRIDTGCVSSATLVGRACSHRRSQAQLGGTNAEGNVRPRVVWLYRPCSPVRTRSRLAAEGA